MLTIIDMRIPGGWNGVLLVSFVFILVFINYLNIIPLSQTFPFLSFLPHESKPKITKQVTTATPTPLPPITVKRIDPAKGTGEFIINNPAPQVGKLSLQKQIVIEGIYDINNKKVTISTSVQSSGISLHKPPPLPYNSSNLSLELVSKGKVVYSTETFLPNLDNKDKIPFSVNMPYLKNFTINIYDQSRTLLLSQEVNL